MSYLFKDIECIRQFISYQNGTPFFIKFIKWTKQIDHAWRLTRFFKNITIEQLNICLEFSVFDYLDEDIYHIGCCLRIDRIYVCWIKHRLDILLYLSKFDHNHEFYTKNTNFFSYVNESIILSSIINKKIDIYKSHANKSIFNDFNIYYKIGNVYIYKSHKDNFSTKYEHERFILAIKYNNLEFLKYVYHEEIENKMIIKKMNISKYKTLAYEKGHLDILLWLITTFNEGKISYHTLDTALTHRYYDMLSYLLDHNIIRPKKTKYDIIFDIITDYDFLMFKKFYLPMKISKLAIFDNKWQSERLFLSYLDWCADELDIKLLSSRKIEKLIGYTIHRGSLSALKLIVSKLNIDKFTNYHYHQCVFSESTDMMIYMLQQATEENFMKCLNSTLSNGSILMLETILNYCEPFWKKNEMEIYKQIRFIDSIKKLDIIDKSVSKFKSISIDYISLFNVIYKENRPNRIICWILIVKLKHLIPHEKKNQLIFDFICSRGLHWIDFWKSYGYEIDLKSVQVSEYIEDFDICEWIIKNNVKLKHEVLVSSYTDDYLKYKIYYDYLNNPNQTMLKHMK